MNKFVELYIVFKLIFVTDGCDISSEIAVRLTSWDLSDDKSTLVQVMAWCRQAKNAKNDTIAHLPHSENYIVSVSCIDIRLYTIIYI